MKSDRNWIRTRIDLGRALLILGLIVSGVGVVLQWRFSVQPINFRIVTGLGILLIGIGLSTLARYRSVLKDERAARRLEAEAHDERSLYIRGRAGFRAFWVTIAFNNVGLMWSSFANQGGVPALEGDVLWFFLAAATVVPFLVYIISLVMDEQSS